MSLLPLYFPRSKVEEKWAGLHLPFDVGNEDGEPIVAERQIRIVDKPTFLTPRELCIKIDHLNMYIISVRITVEPLL